MDSTKLTEHKTNITFSQRKKQLINLFSTE